MSRSILTKNYVVQYNSRRTWSGHDLFGCTYRTTLSLSLSSCLPAYNSWRLDRVLLTTVHGRCGRVGAYTVGRRTLTAFMRGRCSRPDARRNRRGGKEEDDDGKIQEDSSWPPGTKRRTPIRIQIG